MIIYVNAAAGRDGNGTKERPFRFINDAAQAAHPGDEVLVAPGVYREYVNPRRAGKKNARITYRSTEPLGAVITGAEEIKNWKHYEGNVWVCRVSNSVFGDYNPYTTYVYGDWYFAGKNKHTGAVYLNDQMLYEADSLDACLKGEGLRVFLESGGFCLQMVLRAGYRRQWNHDLCELSGKKSQRRKGRDQRAAGMFLPGKNRQKLYHRQRFSHRKGRHDLGAAGSFSGWHDRSTLVKGMDHRGL